MSYKSENWKEKLEQVRAYGTFTERKEGSLEESADDVLTREIEEELRLLDEEELVNEAVNYHTKISNINIANAMKNNRILKKYVNVVPGSGTSDTYEIASLLMKQMKKFGFDKKEVKAIEDVMQTAFATNESVKEEVEEKPVKESVEKSIEKLTEKNMLGRLAKQLQLNEEGKQQMFAYFEKGELKQ